MTVKPGRQGEGRAQYANFRLRKTQTRLEEQQTALEYAHCRYISRSGGGSATRSAAYNMRVEGGIFDERTQQLHNFEPNKGLEPGKERKPGDKDYREEPQHHAVLLPSGAPAAYAKPAVLWNAAEAAEKRKNSQVAQEVLLALPNNPEVTLKDWAAMTESFAREHFVSKGLAAQVDIHNESRHPEAKKEHNPHAHLLITTRRIDANGFGAKARDLQPEIRSIRGRVRVTEGEAWGEAWRAHQNQYFREQGYAVRVDPLAPISRDRLRMIGRDENAENALKAHIAEGKLANERAARDPALVIETLTRRSATFTESDIDRLLEKYLPDATERQQVRQKVLTHPDMVLLADRETGETIGRYTAQQVRKQEERVLADAATLVSIRDAKTRISPRPGLRSDQLRAFERVMAGKGLSIVLGRAGTGKSRLLGELHRAEERAGRTVIGMAPTNVAAQNMRGDGIANANTAHSWMFRLKAGMVPAWNSRTTVVVDEAAMLSSEMLGSILAEARAARARVILAGDDRQLGSVERSGLFRELVQRHGAAELTEVLRQRVEWQRQANIDMASGRFDKALLAFKENGAITWRETHEEARAALLAAWAADSRTDPDTRRQAVAFTNRDVDWINSEMHRLRLHRGEIGPEQIVNTAHGPLAASIGDRIIFTANDKKLDIANGGTGTIRAMDASRVSVRGDDGRIRRFELAEFTEWRLAYGTTIHKAQSATRDSVYVLHSKHIGSEAAYVALTRQRDDVRLFVGQDVAANDKVLARQMGREREGAASIAFAVQETRRTTPTPREEHVAHTMAQEQSRGPRR